jgi:hypothetical protein
MSDLAKEIAQTVVRIKSEMRKASFASRSEAGRYAANQRWKGQGKKGKTAVDDLSIRGMTPAKMAASELRAHIDEQEGLLEAMRGNGASKAELKQQKGLITLARRDLRRMEEEQEEVVGVNKFPVAADAEKQSSNHANFTRLREESAVDKAFSRKTLSGLGSYLRGEKYKDIGVKPFNVDAKDATEEDYAFAEKSLKEIKEIQEPLLDQASKAILDFDNGRASAEVSIKALRGVRNKLKKEGVKVLAQQKADGFFPESKSETTIRSMTYYTKSLQFDFAARWVDGALGEIVSFTKGKGNYVINDMSKAQFASRSEAGRYAANMRWQGQGQASAAGAGSSLKHKVDFKVMSSGRFTHVQGQGFDGQVKYMIGNENEFPDNMDYGFAFSMPGEGFVHAAILKSGFSQKVMSNRNHTPSLDEIKNRAVELNQELGQAVSDHLKTLNIREIATGIEQEYTRADKTIPKAVANAVATLKPLRDINDVYGYSTGQRIVADALKSLKGFDSEVGKLVKTELKGRVKNASPKPPTAGMRRAKSLPFAELRSN